MGNKIYLIVLIFSVFIINSCEESPKLSGGCGQCTPWADGACGVGECEDWEMQQGRQCAGDIFSDERPSRAGGEIPLSPPKDVQYSLGDVPPSCLKRCVIHEECTGCSEDCSQEGCEGQTCGENMICIDGICELNCPDDWFDCSGECIDPLTDKNHCGECNNHCAMGYECVNGICNYDCTYYGGECTQDFWDGQDAKILCTGTDLCELDYEDCILELTNCNSIENTYPNCECQEAHKECIENTCTHIPGWGFCAGEGLVGECEICYYEDNPNLCFMNEWYCDDFYDYGCWWDPETNIDLCQSDEMCEDDCESDGCNGNCPEGCSGNDPDCYCSYSYKNGCCGIGCNFYNDKDCCIEPEPNMVITENTYFCEGEYEIWGWWLNIADDNLIVECDNTKIIGDGEGPWLEPAIKINNKENIAIKGCNIEYQYNDKGIEIIESYNITLDDMEVKQSLTGIFIGNSELIGIKNSKIEEINPNWNNDGPYYNGILAEQLSAINIYKSGKIFFKNNIIRNNAHNGIYINGYDINFLGYNNIVDQINYDIICDNAYIEEVENIEFDRTNCDKLLGFVCGDHEISQSSYEGEYESFEIGEECETDNDCSQGETCYNCQCVSSYEPGDTNCENNEDGEYTVKLYNWLIDSGEKDSCGLINVRSDFDDDEATYQDYIIDDAFDCCINDGVINNKNTKVCEYARTSVYQSNPNYKEKECVRNYIEKNLRLGLFEGPKNHLEDELWLWNYFWPEYCCEGYTLPPYHPMKGFAKDMCQTAGGIYGDTGGCANPYFDPLTGLEYHENMELISCPGPGTPGLCKLRERSSKETLGTIHSGLCNDWSFAAVALLRKTGFYPANEEEGHQVLSSQGGIHNWNLIWDEQVGKWVIYDFGNRVEDPLNSETGIAGFPGYCTGIGEVPFFLDIGFEIGNENAEFYEGWGSGDSWDEWAYENVLGCNGECGHTVPFSGMEIYEDTTFCPGIYELEEGIKLMADNIKVEGLNTEIKCMADNCENKIGINTNNKEYTQIEGITFIEWGNAIKVYSNRNFFIRENKFYNNNYAITGEIETIGNIYRNEFYNNKESEATKIYFENPGYLPHTLDIRENYLENTQITITGEETNGIHTYIENNIIRNNKPEINYGVGIDLDPNENNEWKSVKINGNDIENYGYFDIRCFDPYEPILTGEIPNLCFNENCAYLECS